MPQWFLDEDLQRFVVFGLLGLAGVDTREFCIISRAAVSTSFK